MVKKKPRKRLFSLTLKKTENFYFRKKFIWKNLPNNEIKALITKTKAKGGADASEEFAKKENYWKYFLVHRKNRSILLQTSSHQNLSSIKINAKKADQLL